MYILGIDTSCDDTCISIIEIRNTKFEIRSNIVSSQVKLHAKYGGVYPFLAKREHQKNLPVVFKKALRQAQGKRFDLIGVTIGPGLEPCLWQGVNFAKDLAKKLNLKIIPTNHIEAHILANFLLSSNFHDREFLKNFVRAFPAICLVVSGGHTQLILMKEIGKYKLIGETRDDAAGECFDKVARILGLGYPGGPVIDAEAARCKVKGLRFKVCLPRPMIYQKNYDFSFSGLKTAVLYQYQKSKSKPSDRWAKGEKRTKFSATIKNKKYKQAMCHEVQQAIIDVLIYKTIKAAKDFRVKSIILGGGVAASQELRKQFKVQSLRSKVNFLVPPRNLCTDNAAMVAATAYFHQKTAAKDLKKIKANANLKI